MKILFTGVAGFIGNNVARHWLEKNPDDSIVGLDKLTYAGRQENVDELIRLYPDRFTFVKGDILDQALVNSLLRQTEGLIHFAAESHVTRSEDDPSRFYRTNVEGTRILLAEAEQIGNLEKIIHVSTDEVYGATREGYFKETDKAPGATMATSAYAKSKALADDLAESYYGNLPLMIVRPTNNFGPRQYPEKALPRWTTNALNNQSLPIWGEGAEVRDWLHTSDTYSALNTLWLHGETGQAYNIGANHDPERDNLAIAKLVLEVLDKSDDLIEMIPNPRPDHDFRYAVDTEKIRSLGWQPGNFMDQFISTINWYKENRHWWEAVKAEAEALYVGKEKRS